MFDSYRNLMSRGSICGRLLEKTACFHLSLSLLNETSKWYSSRMKVVWDLKLSFDRYQNLVSRRTWLPTISRVTVFLRLLSKYRTKRRNYLFSNESCWRLSFDSYGKFMSRGNFLRTTTRKKKLLQSVVKVVEWNTKGVFFLIEGCWWPKTIVR